MPSLEELLEKSGAKPIGELQNTTPTTTPTTPETTPITTPVTPTTPPATPSDQQPKMVMPSELFGEEWKDKDWDGFKSDYQTRLQKAKGLEARLQELEERKPEYADEEVAKYDAWIRNGGQKDYDAFKFMSGYNPESVDDIDKVVMETVLKNPDLRQFKDKLKDQLINKYGLAATDDNELSPEQVAFNKAQFKEVAKQADEFLKQQSEKLKVVDAPAAKFEEIYGQRKPKWQTEMDAILNSITKIPVPIVEKEGDRYVDKVFSEFELPAKVLQDYKEKLMPYLVDNYAKASDVTPELINHAKAQVLQRAIVENLPFIVSDIKAKIEKELTDEFDKKYNGGILKAPGGASTVGGQPTAKEVVSKVLGA